MRCYVGVDGGGSKTSVAVAGETGRVIGRVTTGPSNYQALGIDVASARVALAIAEAVQAARELDETLDIAGLCLALAGVGRPEDDLAWRGAVERWTAEPSPGVRWVMRATDAVITHDAMAALVGGTGRREGVVVIAGTGAIAFGVNARGDQRRASGWGYLLGDEGSGCWIGLAGLRAICRADDRRGPPTALAGALLAARALSQPQELVKPVYSEWKPADFAALAPIVLHVAAQGDAVARGIVEDACRELAAAALSVLRGLDLIRVRAEVVTAGGLWNPLLRERFAACVALDAPHAAVSPPRAEPVIGALHLARGVV